MYLVVISNRYGERAVDSGGNVRKIKDAEPMTLSEAHRIRDELLRALCYAEIRQVELSE